MQSSNADVRLIVLVAEDEALVRLVANDMLTDADYQVVEARDGQEALAILSVKNTVRALLTDVNMPNVDGLALAKIVRKRWPHIGVIVTSGLPVLHALPSGVHFIGKPYSHEEVLRKLQTVIAETANVHASTVGMPDSKP